VKAARDVLAEDRDEMGLEAREEVIELRANWNNPRAAALDRIELAQELRSVDGSDDVALGQHHYVSAMTRQMYWEMGKVGGDVGAPVELLDHGVGRPTESLLMRTAVTHGSPQQGPRG
jgi:hypothetical protein